MSTPVSADPAVLLPIRLRVDRDGSISFPFYDTNDDPYPINLDAWIFRLKINSDRTDTILTITTSTGITFPSTHILKIAFTQAITQIEPKTYYYELFNDTSNQTIFNGDAFVINGKWKG